MAQGSSQGNPLDSELTFSTGTYHNWGYKFNIRAERSTTPCDNRVHIIGYIDTGAWHLSPGYSYQLDPMSGWINIGGHVINVSHPPFDCRYSACGENNLIRTNIDFWTGDFTASSMSVTGYIYNAQDGARNGNYSIVPIGPPPECCDPDPVGPWGAPYATIPNHPTNPNPQPSFPTNTILGKYYTSQTNTDIYYPRTTLEQVYRYPPIIRTLSKNYSEADAYNIPFDVDKSPITQKWGYYDNTYFYIYRTGLYDVSCSAYIIDRKKDVGPKICTVVNGNQYAWLKIARNPYTHQNKNDKGENTDTTPACEWLTGRISYFYRDWFMLQCRNLLWLNAGDKIFARVGWQYGNGNGYDFRCVVGGEDTGSPTIISITPLVFQDEDIEF